jgi:hypothetical protein
MFIGNTESGLFLRVKISKQYYNLNILTASCETVKILIGVA